MANKSEIPSPLDTSLLDSFAELVPDVIARFDPNFRHLYVNPVIEKITGRPRSEFLGKSNRELGMPEEQVKLWEAWLNKTVESRSRQEVDFVFPSPQGDRHFHAVGVPEFSSDGALISILVITRDITERKKHFDEALLSAKFSSTVQLCSDLSHQINNPLTVISGKLRSLEISKAEADDGSFLKNIESARSAIERIKDIVDTMSRLTRSAHRQDDENRNLSVSEIITLAVSLCRLRGKSSGVGFETIGQSDHRGVWLLNDCVEGFYQVLANAFEAAKLTPNPWVRVEVLERTDQIDVLVADSGSGIKRSDFERMIQPFFTTKGNAKGMGLFAAKMNFESMGAQFSLVEGTHNTTIKIALPTADRQIPTQSAHAIGE